MTRTLVLFAAILSAGISCPAAPKVLVDDAKARVTVVEVEQAGDFKLRSGPAGAVWISLDEGISVARPQGQPEHEVRTGDFEFVPAGGSVTFRSKRKTRARVLTIQVKRRTQDLSLATVHLDAGQELDDASDRNATLIIPISPVRLRDVRNIGDESEWKSSQPKVLRLAPAQAAWIRAGEHRLKNLAANECTFVTVEW